MIKMNDFEKDLANVMGSFMEINLDCAEKQKQEIEQLQNNWNELKKYVEEEISKISKECGLKSYINKISPYANILNKMQELERGKDEQ